jgi:hypothetical protein
VSQLQLQWTKCTGQEWCQLMTLDLGHSSLDGLEGVYIIWHGGTNPWTVRVGQGIIRDRLRAHRTDAAIQQFLPLRLFVTYARVDAGQRDGVERFLAERLQPRLPGRDARFPSALPISANLPW